MQRRDRGLDEERRDAEADAVALLERFLLPLAQRHHRRHVHLVEGGEHGGGVLRLDQAARDRLAALGHAHARLAAAAGGHAPPALRRGRPAPGCARRGRWRHGRRCAARPARQARPMAAWTSCFITRPALPEPCTRAQVHVVILRDAPGRGRGARVVRRSCRSPIRWTPRPRVWPRPWRSARPGGGRGRGRAALVHDGQQFADLDVLALLARDAGEDAALFRAHLEVDLLGLELDDGLADLDAVAGLLQPARDARLDDRFAELWNDDVGHGDVGTIATSWPPRSCAPASTTPPTAAARRPRDRRPARPAPSG